MSSSMLATKAFCDIAIGRNAISVFECKCALVRSFGTEVPVRQIGRILQRECGWNPIGEGVTLEQFSALYSTVEYAQSIESPKNDHYNVFDTRNKGWIEERDLYKVYMMVAPSFAEKHVKSIFAAADSNHVGQISRRYYTSTVEEQKKLSRNSS